MTPGERRLHEEILNLREEYERTRPLRFIKRRSIAEHGTRSRYQQGCRCSPCRLANRDYSRKYRQGRMSA